MAGHEILIERYTDGDIQVQCTCYRWQWYIPSWEPVLARPALIQFDKHRKEASADADPDSDHPRL